MSYLNIEVPFFMIVIAAILVSWFVVLVFIIHFSANVFERIGFYVLRLLEKKK
jgi:hypothetical protein